jgi:hypothetical protein
MSKVFKSELEEQFERLGEEQQRQLLDFARALSSTAPCGTAGLTLIRFAGAIESADLDKISSEIEAGCEQVNLNEW